MQKRNLKSLVAKKEDKRWYYWVNPLNYTPWRLYHTFLEEYAGCTDGVATYYYYDTVPDVQEYDMNKKASVLALPVSRAKVREFDFNKIKKHRSFSFNFNMRRPRTSNPLKFDYPIKWVLLNLRRVVRLREGRLGLRRDPKIRVFRDFDIERRLRQKQIDSQRMHIKDYAAVNQELVEIEPYVKNEEIDTVLEIPMAKKQINKGIISQRSLEKIRTILAQHVKAQNIDIEIVGVYEDFQYELYKNIRHNAKTGDILCFLDPSKRSIKNPKRPYLLIGKKRSDGRSFTVLADSDKLAL